MRKILITGAAGFIGTNLIAKLLKDEDNFIVGVDNLDPYYDTRIKLDNIKSNANKRFVFEQYDVTNEYLMRTRVFEKYGFDAVIHLAAQAGVSYSIDHSYEVMTNNIMGFEIMIKLSHTYGVKKFIYASSSTVLGDHNGLYIQKSPYGVSKATNEAQGSMYAGLYPDMHIIGMRLYTVYGERMRPDLAICKFTKAIMNDETIHIYGDGSITRDFTYIGDVTEAFKTVLYEEPRLKMSGYIYNVGWGRPISLTKLIETMKTVYGKEGYDKLVYESKKPYDAIMTQAWGESLKRDYGFECKVTLEEGLKRLKNYLYNS